jgi:hypothetical protein
MSMTRYAGGFSTARSTRPLAITRIPTRPTSTLYENDFNTYVAGDWTITVVGTSTPALVAGDGGILGITTSASVGR